MNRLIMAIATVTVSAMAASAPGSADSSASSPFTGAASTATGATPALASGLDGAGYDRKVRPQDDLFRFVNGEWLRTTEIPPDRSNYGAFTALDDKAQADLRALIDEAAASANRPKGSDAQKVGDFYGSFMDTARADQLGIEPLRTELARIDAIADKQALVTYLGAIQSLGVSQPIGFYVAQDEKNTTAYIPIVTQSGLTLPDRDYYLKTEPKDVAIREKYVAYVSRIAVLAGLGDPVATAQRVLALETRLAGAQWTRVQNRDAVATYNKHSLESARALTPGLDWTAFFAAAGVDTQNVVISQPSFFTALGKAIDEVPLEDWKTYHKFKLVDDYAPALSAAFVDAHFDLHSRTLKGIKENRPRWKRGVEAVDRTMGEIAGRLYVERHFRPEAKQRMDELVANLIRAYEVSIDELEWMSPQTRRAARAKLAKFTVKIGYPSKWKDYSGLEIAANDLVGNLMRSAAVEHRRTVGKLGKPIDRTEWLMTPQTVNAYYYPPMNEIVFPAAILQPPFFNVAADDAVNYGAIGAVIGHEISHGFDDQGRRYDGDGNLRDWWTPEDEKRFKERASGLVAQYAKFNPIDDKHVNGELTLGENIGDLSGLAVAFRAYQLSLKTSPGGKPAAVIDGFTGEQRFFMGWSQVWRRKYRDEELRMRLVTDPHSPSEYRANGIVSNMNEFYRAFEVKEGDRLFRPEGERVRIW